MFLFLGHGLWQTTNCILLLSVPHSILLSTLLLRPHLWNEGLVMSGYWGLCPLCFTWFSGAPRGHCVAVMDTKLQVCFPHTSHSSSRHLVMCINLEYPEYKGVGCQFLAAGSLTHVVTQPLRVSLFFFLCFSFQCHLSSASICPQCYTGCLSNRNPVITFQVKTPFWHSLISIYPPFLISSCPFNRLIPLEASF